MYDELIKRLRDSEHEIDCYLCDCDCCYPSGKVHGKCIVIEAADAIEELSMKLHGDEAAIAGMKREIERMVVSNALNTLGNDAMRWISVEERLPEDEDVLYLICKKRVSDNGFFYEVANYAKDLHKVDNYDFAPEDVNGFYRYDSEWGYYKLLFVTHWMPLPQLPKEE